MKLLKGERLKVYAKKNLKINIRDSIMLILVLWLESPYQNFMSFYAYGFLWLAWFALASIASPKALGHMMVNKGFIAISLWVLLRFFLSLIGRDAFTNSYLLYPFILLCLLYYLEIQNYHALKVFLYVYIVYSVLIAVGSISALYSNPMISRVLAASDHGVTAIYATPFVANFLTVNNYPLICGVILFALISNLLVGYERILAIVIMTLDLIVLFMAQYFIAIMTTIVFLVIILLGFVKSKVYKILGTILTIFAASVGIFFRSIVLNKLLEWFGDGVIGEKIYEITRALENNNMSDSAKEFARVELYMRSLETFLNNLFIGVGGKEFKGNGLVGGHSQILDFLAYHGIFFGIVFVYVFWGVYGVYKEYLNGNYRKLYGVVIGTYFISNFLNLCFAPEMFFVVYFIIPVFLILLQRRGKLVNFGDSGT